MNALPRRWFLAALIAPIAAGGCASLYGDPPLEIMLSDVATGQGGGVGDAPLQFVIRLENSSPEALTVDGGSYRIRLNGSDVGQGLSNETLQLDRLSSATVTVPVHVSTVRLAGSLFRILNSNQVTYQLNATLYVRHGERSRKYRVSRAGTVNFAEVQETLTRSTTP
ncbi:MAG: LEA type 2 family protein [Verrucomicrobiae bacterium]|nr:LEA type 2 family protein [Verrucomicrobiae bacterium]